MFFDKNSLVNLHPKTIFLRIADGVLGLKIKPMRFVTRLISNLMFFYHIVQLIRTRNELRRMNPTKAEFPYEDYSTYL